MSSIAVEVEKLQAEFLHNYLDLGLLHIPEQRHLERQIHSLIVTQGEKTAQNLSECTPEAPHRSSISRHYSGKWDSKALLDSARAAMIEQWDQAGVVRDCQGVVYHIVDDTANPHNPANGCLRPQQRERTSRCMEDLDLHRDASAGRTCWAHSVVSSHVVWGNWSLPWRFELYRREDHCKQLGIEFHSKVDLACSFIRDFVPPGHVEFVCHLMDSWYVNHKSIGQVLARKHEGHFMVGALSRRTRLWYGPHDEKQTTVEQVMQELTPSDLDVVTVSGRTYEYWRYEGKVAGYDDMVVVIVREQGHSRWRAVLCTRKDLSTQQILAHYLVRWHIEVGYWYLKCALGFGDYRLRPMDSIQRFWSEVWLAYWFLEWLRHRLKLPRLADARQIVLEQHRRKLIGYIWSQAKAKTPLKTLYETFGCAA